MESLQGPKEHWQCKQRKSNTPYERHCQNFNFSTSQCHVDSIALPVLCWYGEWPNLRNLRNPVPIYTTRSEEFEKVQFQFILQVPTRAPTVAVMAELG